MKKFWIQLVARLPLADTTIVIAAGRASAYRGNPRSMLLAELSDLARQVGIECACIHASPVEGSAFKLRLFGVPHALHQRFRNVWGANWR